MNERLFHSKQSVTFEVSCNSKMTNSITFSDQNKALENEKCIR